ncbi:DNA repair protein SWI5 homolog isoform X2 [Rhincodon typus]|uniref:DNA repair protein SWI5 homolog isoform X2 n=1 Tax=Rhincodon typus TaxID=259920 RepID=UPI0020301F9D|nr:DNA repair protein SWI5 homolog isoform X2 [Rhincodon typus]
MAIGCLRSRVRKLRVPMAAERERGDAGQCSPRSGFSAPEQLLCTRTPSNREGGGTAGRSFRRTPLGPSRKLNASFKSPVQISLDHELDSAGLQLHVENLRKKCNNLDREIAELLSAGYTLEELDQHIDQHHEYNDIKDVGQLLLGKLGKNTLNTANRKGNDLHFNSTSHILGSFQSGPEPN